MNPALFLAARRKLYPYKRRTYNIANQGLRPEVVDKILGLNFICVPNVRRKIAIWCFKNSIDRGVFDSFIEQQGTLP